MEYQTTIATNKGASPMAAAKGRRQADSLHVLVVEDGLVYQKLAVHALKEAGHQVRLANNGNEAIDAVQSHVFDLVLMDVEMPEMDGLEATRWIRRHEQPTGSRLPILGLTTIADPERCLAAGMNAHLPKPYPPDVLLAAIDRVLYKSVHSPSPDRPKRILLVDDDPQIVEPLRHALQDQGDTVIVATGCQEALKLADVHTPDLLVLDIVMPECNGLAMLEQLRKAGQRELPVIVMTGSDCNSYVVRANQLGAKDFVRKPFPPTRIVKSVNRLLAV